MKTLNKLKVAIAADGRKQRQIGRAARPPIRENRLSNIVCGSVVPRADEREAIARVLGVPEEDLFDVETGLGLAGYFVVGAGHQRG